jgi:hypothetical protein
MSPRTDPDVVGHGSPTKSSMKKSTTRVSFNSSMDVVLIPSRFEYFKYSCDLWWGKSDYTIFQQSAFSEIRLFALCECIEFKKARQKLYQPNGDEKIVDEPEKIGLSAKSSGDESNALLAEHFASVSPCMKKTNSETKRPETIPDDDGLHLCVRLSDQLFSFEKARQLSIPRFPIHLGLAALTLPILGFYLFGHILS